MKCTRGIYKYVLLGFGRLSILTAIFIFICMAGIYNSVLFANPQGGVVRNGNATITNPSTNTVQINQTSDKAIINWHSFNIGSHETTNFNQPSSKSITFNRIDASQGASQIYGNLTANGRVILTNSSGIYFGPTAYVNVAGLIATTSNLSDTDFLNDYYHFTADLSSSGSVINEGRIVIAEHGLIALVAPGVVNNGLIQANVGQVILASGNAFTITFANDGLINFAVSTDQHSKRLSAGVSNSGTIIANGGTILISAQAAVGVLDNVIDMQGVLQAHSIATHNGEIILLADNGGKVIISGNLDVSGQQQKGGEIKILADHIYLSNTAVLNASGDTGGGEISIKGNSTTVAGALLAANALIQGDGGFIETSGAYLDVTGIQINLSAIHGTPGTWLLDPDNIIIQTAGATTATASGSPTNTYTSNVATSIITIADLENALANASVLVVTGVGGIEAGDITVANNITWANTNSLTLSAFRNINVNATITNSVGGSLSLQADNTGTGTGTIIFSGVGPQINMSGGGAVNFYYNPVIFPTATNYASNVNVSGGTTFTPYMLVNNLIDLQNINNNLSGNYALGRNIDATATNAWNAGAGFVPIGSLAANFTGQFDGQNYTIDSLTIFLPLADNVGLFGYLNSPGKIQNIALTNMVVTGLNNVGGLIGFDLVGAINNAHSAGSVTSGANSSNVGGLIGFSNGLVSNSSSTATVFAGATSNYVGGLVGKANGSINTSFHATGLVTGGATSDYVGGLVGYNLGSLSHVYNTGPVVIGATGSAYFGGLVGYSAGNVYYSYSTGSVTAGAAVSDVGGLIGYALGTVNNSYSTGAIVTGATGSMNIGGLVGFAANNVNNSYSTSSILGGAANSNVGGLVGQNNAIISNSYSAGSVAAGAGSAFVGGLVGLNNTTVTDSFWDVQTSAQLASAGGTGKTTAEMMQQTTFCPSGNCNGDLSHFDFVTNWGIVNGVTYPFLLSATLTYQANPSSMTYGGTVPFLSGTVTGFVGSETQMTATTGTLSFTSLVTSNSNVGNYAINGSGLTANNGNYVFVQAAGNTSAFSVTQANLTITANNQSKTYGDTLALGTSAFTPVGLQNSETIGSVTLTSSGSGALANVSTSPYNIVPSAATGGTFTASNYTINYVNGVLTVNPATLTYNANLATMTYGSAVPTLSGTVTGFVNSQTQAGATTGTLAFNSSATSTSNVGSYAINGSGLTANNGNYVFVQAAGNTTAFSVTQANLTITASNQSKTYGDTLALGTSAFTPVGLQNSETIGSVTLTSSGSGALANVSTSPYNIVPSVATGGTFTASNYTINYVNGVLTVNPATLTYNANLATMTNGSTMPSLSGTVTGFVNGQTQANATTGTLAFNSPATSTSSVGSYAINGSGLTANNGNYQFIQSINNATALTISPATSNTPTIVVPANVVTLNPTLALVSSILRVGTEMNDFTVDSKFIDITNNTDTSVINARNIMLENTYRSSNASMTIVSNNMLAVANSFSWSTSRNNNYFIEEFILIILAIILIDSLITYWIFWLIRDRNETKRNLALIMRHPYMGHTSANEMNMTNVPKELLDYIVTTNVIFTGTKWVTVSRYSDPVIA